MGKSKKKITNWKESNQALINRSSLTFWMDDDAIANWYCDSPSGHRGIDTAPMLAGLFNLPLRALLGFNEFSYSAEALIRCLVCCM